jgi:hypothetical protein
MNSKSLNPFASDPFNTMAEPVAEKVVQAVDALETESAPAPVKAKPAARKKASGQPKGRKLYMQDDLYQRLRLMAIQENKTVSQVAAEILDAQVPRFTIRKAG